LARKRRTSVARLIYSAIASLDGYIADDEGKFDWAEPDEEIHRFVNDLERPVGTYLYGRRMYEMMAPWETMAPDTAYAREFAQLWRAADKIVYSSTLEGASTARTRIERSFDAVAVSQLKAAATRDISVGGAHLAGQAIASGVVDEIQLLLTPVVVGGGTRALPDGVHVALALIDERRFADGTVFVRYETR